MQILDLINYLPGSVLTKADRSSMDWGLETPPLLNTRIALAALSLKPEQLVNQGKMKTILRKLLSRKVGNMPYQGPNKALALR